jgi:hypothetical protein
MQVVQLLKSAHRSLALLVRHTRDLGRLRNHVIKHGLHPRQVGGPTDFEEARKDIEHCRCSLTPSASSIMVATGCSRS